MGFLLTLLVIGYALICIFLVTLILLQAGKGGGLSGLVGGSAFADTFGATGAEKTFARWTTYLAVLFFILSLGLTYIGARHFTRPSLLDRLQREEAASATQPLEQPEATAPEPISAPVDETVPVEPAIPPPQEEGPPPVEALDMGTIPTEGAQPTGELEPQAESPPALPESDTTQP